MEDGEEGWMMPRLDQIALRYMIVSPINELFEFPNRCC